MQAERRERCKLRGEREMQAERRGRCKLRGEWNASSEEREARSGRGLEEGEGLGSRVQSPKGSSPLKGSRV